MDALLVPMRAQAGLAEDELLQKLAHWETVVAQHARRWEVLYAWVKMLGQLAGMRNDTIRISSPEGAALEELLQAAGMGALGVEPQLRFAPRKNQKRAINEKGP